jgi:hypothetical protein
MTDHRRKFMKNEVIEDVAVQRVLESEGKNPAIKTRPRFTRRPQWNQLWHDESFA